MTAVGLQQPQLSDLSDAALIALLLSPAFTGTPTAPTQSVGDNTTAIATDAFVLANGTRPTPAVCSIVEEFIGGNSTAGTEFSNNWFSNTIGSAPVFAAVGGVTPNLGIIQLSTAVAATAGQGGSIFLVSFSAGGSLVSNLQSNTGWELQWIFKLSQTTATRFRVGIAGSGVAIVPGNGLSCRYDTNATFADTTFVFESTVGGVVTKIDSGIAVDTNWHRVKINSSVAGTAIFTLYDAAGVQLAQKSLAISFGAGISMSPVAIIGTDASAQKTIQLDYMSFYMSGLAR